MGIDVLSTLGVVLSGPHPACGQEKRAMREYTWLLTAIRHASTYVIVQHGGPGALHFLSFLIQNNLRGYQALDLSAVSLPEVDLSSHRCSISHGVSFQLSVPILPVVNSKLPQGHVAVTLPPLLILPALTLTCKVTPLENVTHRT